MRACTKTHQSLYERHSGGTLIFVNAVAFSSYCAVSGDTGSEKRVFLQPR